MAVISIRNLAFPDPTTLPISAATLAIYQDLLGSLESNLSVINEAQAQAQQQIAYVQNVINGLTLLLGQAPS